jgi:Holliday junction resolvasome RuvABC endonuclease subunit
MSEHELDSNKINDKQKRRAEHIEDKLKKHGMGEGQAEKESVKQAVEEQTGGRGGGSSGGDAKAGHT